MLGFMFMTSNSAYAQCSSPLASSLTTCNVGFTGCNKCAGMTDCCANSTSSDYGVCKDSNAYECPDGSKFICNGGNCPSGIRCNYVKSTCPTPGKCWGSVVCTGSSCPSGYYNGMFCHQDGRSGNFKVCCSLAPTPPVVVNCAVSDWSTWGPCVEGMQTRTRTVVTPPLNGGSVCPELSQSQSCPINCTVSEWGPWSNCVNFQQTRTRTIVTPPLNGGTLCPTVLETQACTGCGPDLIVFDCVLDQTKPTTTCTLPGGVLTVVVQNKKGYKKANVRVNAKPIGYTN